jgi:aryl-alcohol dehydrogenase-like predicted oxidoreductase
LYRDIETELLPLCRDQGMGVIAYNPLAGGFLSGKYTTLDEVPAGTRFSLGKSGELYRERYWHKAQHEAVQHLRRHFDAKGMSLVRVAIAWVLAQPGITSAIIGASKPEQMTDSLAAVETTLDEQDREVCNLAWYSMPRPVQPPR